VLSASPAKDFLARVSASRGRGTPVAPVSVAGIGLHSGALCAVQLVQCPPGDGIRFERDGVRFPAAVSSVRDTRRCTSLGCDGVQVDTVEHVLSALWMLGVDDAVLRVDGPEIPIRDGSALPWVDDLLRAGIRRHAAPAE